MPKQIEDNKLPPHNDQAEEAVLGSILIDGELIKAVKVQQSDFYYDQNGIIFGAMLDLKEKGSAINELTVAQRLNEKDKLTEIGGAAQLAHLVSICPTSLDCDQYAEIVHRLAVSRQLITAGDRISAIGYEGDGNVTSSLAKADSILLKLRQHAGSTTIITPEERVQILIDRYTKLNQNEQGIALKTGLDDLDRVLGGGLFPGDLDIVGGRPGMGKTAFLQCIANHIALNNNVLFCSAEMNIEGLSDRDVAGQIKVPIQTIRSGGYTGEVIDDILNIAIPQIGKLKVYSMDLTHSPINTSTIYQAAYELKNRNELSAVFVDYLGLLSDQYGNNNNDRLGYISRNLKQVAMSLDIPIVAANQLNRAVEAREEKRPKLSDLRDSGNIEQDADNVIFLYRESYYRQANDNTTEVLVAKQRQGPPLQTVKLHWDNERQTYQNIGEE